MPCFICNSTINRPPGPSQYSENRLCSTTECLQRWCGRGTATVTLTGIRLPGPVATNAHPSESAWHSKDPLTDPAITLIVDKNRVTKLMNLNEEIHEIARLLGPEVQKYYS